MIGRASRASALPLLLLLLSAASAASRATESRPPGVELAVRRLAPGMVAALVDVDGTKLWMLVDTGATRSRIDGRLAARLGLRPQARYPMLGLDGRERLALCAPATIAFPIATARGSSGAGASGVGLPEQIEARVECLAWSAELPVPLGLDGVLGADALTQADVLLDTEAGRVRVAPPGSLRPWIEGETIPASWIGGRPAIAARLVDRGAETSGLLVLDSGADTTLLFGALARRLRAATVGPDERRLTLVSTTGSSVAASSTRLLSLQVGRLELGPHSAVLLPEVVQRDELGVLHAAALGPTLYVLHDGEIVVGARLRHSPAESGLQIAAIGTLELRIAP